jgi:hypothetical protein
MKEVLPVIVRLTWKTALIWAVSYEVGFWTLILLIWIVAVGEFNAAYKKFTELIEGFKAMRELIADPDDPVNRTVINELKRRGTV